MTSNMPEGMSKGNPRRDSKATDDCGVILRCVERFQNLVSQLLQEGRTQKEVGKLLGVRQHSVSRLLNGERGAGIDLVELAVRKLKIDPRFFFATFEGVPRYRDFVGPHKLPQMGHAAFFRFLRIADEMGIDLSSREKDALERQDWDGEPTPESYQLLLQAVRTVRQPSKTQTRMRAVETVSRREKRTD